MNVHPTAIIDPEAEIGADVTIGPYCVIGPAVVLGESCWLRITSLSADLLRSGYAIVSMRIVQLANKAKI